SSRRRHTISKRDWSSDVCSSDLTSGSSTQSLANYIQELINTHEKLEPPKKISHIGIAVHRLDDALQFYTDTLGLSLEGVEEVSSENVKVAFLRIGETRFELLEPL